MSKIITTIEARIFLELTPGEAGALDAICGYGPDKFLEWFEKNHGKYYIGKYRSHINSLFDKARKLDYAIKDLEKAKERIREISC
jgi:hypothetical protein